MSLVRKKDEPAKQFSRRILLKAVQANLRNETPDELSQWVFSNNINDALIAPKLREMHREGGCTLADMVNRATNMENDHRMRRTTLETKVVTPVVCNSAHVAQLPEPPYGEEVYDERIWCRGRCRP